MEYECDGYINQFPSAWREHRLVVAALVKYLGADLKRFVELGVMGGFSFFSVVQAIKEYGIDAECVGVDTWLGDPFTGSYPGSVYDMVNTVAGKIYTGQRINLIRNTFAKARAEFEGKKIDLLHIDGSHDYASVKDDVDKWVPLLSEQGILLMHDINVPDFGVRKVFEELVGKKDVHCYEHKIGYGLGIMKRGDALSTELVKLFDLKDRDEGEE